MPFQNTVKQTFTDPDYLATRARFWAGTHRVSITSPIERWDERHCEWCDDVFEYRVNMPTPRRFCSDRCRSAASWDRYHQRQQETA